MNNKTQYFIIKIHKKYKPAILWRIKDNEATVFGNDLGFEWKETDCTVENILIQREMKQITRNEARKLFPAAFRKSINLNPRPKKVSKLRKHDCGLHKIPVKIPEIIIPKSEARKVSEFEGEFFGMAPKVSIDKVSYNRTDVSKSETKLGRIFRAIKEFLLDNSLC